MNKKSAGLLLVELGLAVGLLACRERPEPKAVETPTTPAPATEGEIILTPNAQGATATFVEMTYPALISAPKAEYETQLPGETFHITAYGTEGIDFIPVSFTRFVGYLEEHVIGKPVFVENDLPLAAGNITLKSLPQGPHHFIDIVRDELALNPQEDTNPSLENTDQVLTAATMVDKNSNSISIIPTGGNVQTLSFGIVDGLFAMTVGVSSDAHFKNPRLETTLRQSYSAAVLAAQYGHSYEGYLAFADDLYVQGLLDNEPVSITPDSYDDLTAAVAAYQLPAFFTINPTQ